MIKIKTAKESAYLKRICVCSIHVFEGDLRFAMSGDLDHAIEEAVGNSDEETFCKCYGYPEGWLDDFPHSAPGTYDPELEKAWMDKMREAVKKEIHSDYAQLYLTSEGTPELVIDGNVCQGATFLLAGGCAPTGLPQLIAQCFNSHELAQTYEWYSETLYKLLQKQNDGHRVSQSEASNFTTVLRDNFDTIAKEVASSISSPWTDRFNEDMWENPGLPTY